MSWKAKLRDRQKEQGFFDGRFKEKVIGKDKYYRENKSKVRKNALDWADDDCALAYDMATANYLYDQEEEEEEDPSSEGNTRLVWTDPDDDNQN